MPLGIVEVSGELFSAASPQHKGLGKKLIREAERIVKKESASRWIAVISGIGARGYYRKLGYSQKDGYMVKSVGSEITKESVIRYIAGHKKKAGGPAQLKLE